MAVNDAEGRRELYEKPALRVLGTMHDLTLQVNKVFQGSDGTFLQPGNIPLGNSSI